MKKLVYMIPNFLTVIRIICAIIILFVPFLSLPFFYLYFVGGLTDILDGYIARRFEVTSQFGAVLDSIADTFFFLVLVVTLILHYSFPFWMIAWIILIALIRFASLFVGFIKYHAFSFLHTKANKFTGLIIFFLPILIVVLSYKGSIIICGIIATVSAVEEFLINLFSSKLNRNISSIFSINTTDTL